MDRDKTRSQNFQIRIVKKIEYGFLIAINLGGKTTSLSGLVRNFHGEVSYGYRISATACPFGRAGGQSRRWWPHSIIRGNPQGADHCEKSRFPHHNHHL